MSQTELFDRKTASEVVESENYSGLRVMVGLSGGINSMALLCMLAALPLEQKPLELHLFYAHLTEHSPDTEAFVHAGHEYAKLHFDDVRYTQTNHSVLEFFESIRLIPHPTRGFCTDKLKVAPMLKYMITHRIQLDLVGYVREEKKRALTMYSKDANLAYYKGFPILELSNEDCFEIVRQEIGWYPAIYKIVNEKGKRVFSHNNCLPCKNMDLPQIRNVGTYYPEYMDKALATSAKLKAYWGRDADAFYTEFGREDHEANYQPQPCEICNFD